MWRKFSILRQQERLQIIVLSKTDSLKLFLSHYTESADFKEKEEAIMKRKFSILAQPFRHFLSHYKESADAKEKEEALIC